MKPSLEAIVLCGGLGTRLRSLYAELPKALVPVNGRPFINYLIDDLSRQGVQHIHMAAGYRAIQIKEWAEQQRRPGISITVSVEPALLGTAGGIKFALPHLLNISAPFLVINGDSLLPNANVADLIEARQQHEQMTTWIAAVEMTERGQYGTVECDRDRRVTAFREKAANDRGWVNGGIYLMDASLLKLIPDYTACSIEKDIFPKLVVEGRLGAVQVSGPLLDMGTPEGLEQTATYLAARS